MSHKRKIHETTFHDVAVNPKSNKRLKLNDDVKGTTGRCVTSQLFSNKHDQQQFQLIYEAVMKCDSMQHAPESIIEIISEFATGSIEKCDNYESCHNEIAMLHEDKLQSNEQRNWYYFDPKNKIAAKSKGQNNHNRSQQDEDINDDEDAMEDDEDELDFWEEIFNDSNREIQLFCSECSKHLQQCSLLDKVSSEERYYCSAKYVADASAKCECGQKIQMCSQHTEICSFCKVPMCQPCGVHCKYQCEYHGAVHCMECHEYPICHAHTRQCKLCEDLICEECVIHPCQCESKWEHKMCTETDTEQDLYCYRCDAYVCFECEQGEPREYECKHCAKESKWESITLLCCDCYRGTTPKCRRCGTTDIQLDGSCAFEEEKQLQTVAEKQN